MHFRSQYLLLCKILPWTKKKKKKNIVFCCQFFYFWAEGFYRWLFWNKSGIFLRCHKWTIPWLFQLSSFRASSAFRQKFLKFMAVTLQVVIVTFFKLKISTLIPKYMPNSYRWLFIYKNWMYIIFKENFHKEKKIDNFLTLTLINDINLAYKMVLKKVQYTGIIDGILYIEISTD